MPKAIFLLPKDYKNFTRIPKELRDRINTELKAQKIEKKQELAENIKTILMGWRGIVLGGFIDRKISSSGKNLAIRNLTRPISIGI